MDSCFSSSLIPYQSVSTDTNIGTFPLIIRAAEQNDLKGLTEVLTQSFHPPQGLLYWIYPLLKLGIYEDLRSRLRASSPRYRCLVASKVMATVAGEQEEIVGTIEIALRSSRTWLMVESHTPYISNLAVSNTYRRQGIARKLLLKCEQISLEWGFRELSLHVLENNYQARQLYLTSGYQLYRIEPDISSWLLQHPRRLLLNKKIMNDEK